MSQRWLWLAALPIVAGLAGAATRPLIILSAGWVGFALAMSIARVTGVSSRRVVHAAAGVDSAFAVGALALSGGLASPLWWTLLVGGLGVALQDRVRRAIVTTTIALATAAIVAVGIHPAGLAAAAPVLLMAIAVALSLAGLLWPAVRVRREALATGRAQGIAVREARQRDREHMVRWLELIGRLSATLDHERVLDLALELASAGLLDPEAEPERLVGLLLLRAGDRARIVSGRGLPAEDWRLDFRVDRGLIGETIQRGIALRRRGAIGDGELKRITGMSECRSLLTAPLSHEGETIGVMLFGHPSPDAFGEEQAMLLAAMAEQTMIALQNARRFQDLGDERDRIQELQEEARRRLARDLHDGPTQSMATIAMRASFARRLLERDADAANDEMRKAEELARRTTREVRHMLFTLRPLILESQGLASALHQLGDKTEDLTGHPVLLALEDEAIAGLDAGSQGLVFFIAEEAVHNARKHAEAEHVWVRMWRGEGEIVLEIEDDGVGFNVGAVDASYAQRGSLGMVSMRERTQLLGGTLTVESQEGRGTLVRLRVPVSTSPSPEPGPARSEG
ncbi:MAG TPA: GAF domain-containing sensor histidine kinase [Anaerolineales bacterium]|nr:GAF domain-containing sensor histidine kinase [Anaerolineales bacterium]